MGRHESEANARTAMVAPVVQAHAAYSDLQDTETQGIALALAGVGGLVVALAVLGYFRQHALQFMVLAVLEAIALLGFLVAYRWAARKRKGGIALLLLSALLLIVTPLATIARLDLALVIGGVLVLVSLELMYLPRWWLLAVISAATVPAFSWFVQRQSLWVRVPVLPDPIARLVGSEAIVLACLIIAGLSLILHARGRSLRTRVSVTFGLLFVLPTALGLGAAILMVAMRGERVALTQMQELTAKTAEGFAREIRGLQDALAQVERLERTHLHTLLGAEPGSQAFDYAYAVELPRFGVFAGRHATFDVLSLVAPDGTIVLSSNPVFRGMQFTSAVLSEKSATRPVLDIVSASSSIGGPAVRLVLPVRGARGGVTGFLVGEVALSRLLELLDESQTPVRGAPTNFYLVDDKAQVVMSDPPGAMPAPVVLKDLLQRRAGGDSDGERRFLDTTGDVLLVTYRWFPALDVGLIFERPASSVISRALANAASTWGLFVGAICMALVGVGLLSRVVTSPLRHAVVLAERFADGREVGWPRVTAPDEAGRIVAALSRVSDRFEAQVRDVEARAREQIRSLERQVAWLKTAPQLLEATASARDVASSVRSLAARLVTLPQVDWIGIWLLDDSGSQLILKAAEGVAIGGLRRGEGVVQALSEGTPLCQAFEMGCPIDCRSAGEASVEGVQLALPLGAGVESYGVCEIHLALDHVSQEEMAALQVLASYAGWAVDGVYRQLESQERLERMERLRQAERFEHWHELAKHRHMTFVYDGVEVRAVGDDGLPIEADFVLPIGDPRAPLGQLLVSRRAGMDEVSAEQLTEARAILEEVSDALERARLLATTRQAWVAAQHMLEGLRAMMAAETPAAILDAVMAYGQAPQLDRGWLALWEARWDGDRVLRLVGTRTGEGDASREVSKWWDHALCPVLYADEFEERWILDVKADQELDGASRDFLSLGLGLGSALLCPIECEGEEIGWLILGSREPLVEVPGLGTDVWSALMDYVGLALRRLTALMKARDRAAREERVTVVSERVGRSTDVHAILQSSLHELGRILRASEGVIYLDASTSTSNERRRMTDQVEGESEHT